MAANAFLEDPTWDENDYPMIAPLLSYGRGGDTDVGRFISLIFGTNLTDVVITGENGIIDGQGQQWWEKFHKGELKFTRPYLIEIMYSNNIQISSLTLFNSPSWNVHPIYSRSIHSDLSSKDLTGGQDMWISSIRGQRKVHGIFCRPRLLWWWYSYLKGNSKTGRAGENAVNDIFVILSDSWLDNDEAGIPFKIHNKRYG
ncbi:probable polygalacturonase isoform X3 [Capsicum annuum]|uniref:probable polygalacturonase isoform X3 n=1 Tax=Capsicum annuum TaxID=4072 RepID=UPI001FB19435|nr:probable polygalacturonase isoform X3 [Capsicum annuum]